MDKPEPALAALTAFTGAIRQKFSTHVEGEPEDQLRAPCEALTASIGAVLGHSVTVVGETLLANHGGKPDFGIAVDKLLCGHIELKAPGKGANPEFYTGHDRKQWEKFKNLPNLIYCDGIEWSLYRYGEPLRHARLRADPRTAKSGLTDSTTPGALSRFFNLGPETAHQCAATGFVFGSAVQIASRRRSGCTQPRRRTSHDGCGRLAPVPFPRSLVRTICGCLRPNHNLHSASRTIKWKRYSRP